MPTANAEFKYVTITLATRIVQTYVGDFVTKSGRAPQLDLKAKQELRAAHFDYGTSSSAETVGVQSTAHSAFNGAPGKKSELPEATIADLRYLRTLSETADIPLEKHPMEPSAACCGCEVWC